MNGIVEEGAVEETSDGKFTTSCEVLQFINRFCVVRVVEPYGKGERRVPVSQRHSSAYSV